MPLQGLKGTWSLSCLLSATLGLALSWAKEGAQAETTFPSNVMEPNLVPTQVDLRHPGA